MFNKWFDLSFLRLIIAGMINKPRQKKVATIAARVPPSIKERLEAAAAARFCSASSLVCAALDSFLPTAEATKGRSKS